MVKNIFRTTYLLIISAIALCLPGCEDDPFNKYGGDIPDGMTRVNITASFESFAETRLNSRYNTYTTAGNLMNEVSDICLLAYDTDGNLMEGFPMELTGYTSGTENRTDSDAAYNSSAENKTACIKKNNILMPYGEYYLVAVANIGEYKLVNDKISITKKTSEVLENNASSIGTLDGLRKFKVTWSDDNIRNNRQMLGFFTLSSQKHVPNSQSEFTTVTVNQPNLDLHCWLRRVASKITVDLDGSKLSEGVSVYVKNVRIFNIASDCTLGFGKQHNSETDSYTNYNHTAGEGSVKENQSHAINFSTDTDYNKWPQIAAGSPYIIDPDTKEKKDLHSESADALFFFENMQGNKGPNGDYDKMPVANIGDDGADLKTNLPENGTYIEVEGYYVSKAMNHISSGPIKYRFMIGKDVTKNCDAERNHHYKLTLVLRGYANEYDWNIDYKETKGFEAPNPWYVSYLYNHDSMMPFKYTVPDGYELVGMEAEIIQNPWSADNPALAGQDPNDSTSIMSPYNVANPYCVNYDQSKDPYKFKPDNDSETAYLSPTNKYRGNGFLSLKKTVNPIVTWKDVNKNDWTDWPGYKEENKNLNDYYFFGKGNNIDRSKRSFNVNGCPADCDEREKYTVSKEGKKYTFNIPVFTRARVLVKETGYSGNNPFVGYTRTALIKMTATIKNGSEEKTESYIVPVQQVRRIVNPKGVWRRSGNFEPFHVTMMELVGDNAPEFTPVESDGPWKAEIIGDKNFITLDGRQTVSGETNSKIDFTIRFNRTLTDNTVRNAVVRVLYNNYTCTHLIFVRQGYTPQAIAPDGFQLNGDYNKETNNAATSTTAVEWSTFNMIYAGVEATDPRDEGSMFKFGQSTLAIDVWNNIYNKDNDGEGTCGAPKEGDFINSKGPFKMVDGTGNLQAAEKKWNDDWTPDDKGFTNSLMSKLATVRDFEQLYLTPNIQSGFGVLYADGATTTQTDINEAYGYYRRSKTNKLAPDGKKTDSHRGMRGLFCYYWDREHPDLPCTARNIFFPIGRSGYGHRKEGANTGWSVTEIVLNEGILRYCALGYGDRSATFKHDGPLFSTLYHRPGAIYYAKNKATGFFTWNGQYDTSTAIGLDINYFSFDINCITESNVVKGADACFLRSVKR